MDRFSGTLVTGVWLGNDDNEPTKKVSGGNLPVEIWNRVMTTALRGEKPVPWPGAPASAAAPPSRRRQPRPPPSRRRSAA